MLIDMKEQEKRFGLIAIGKGFITMEQLIEAMKTQVCEDIDKKNHRLIGQILVEMGSMTLLQIGEVLDALDRSLLVAEVMSLRE